MNIPLTVLSAMLAVVASACTQPAIKASANPVRSAPESASPAVDPRQALFDRLTALCGQAFAGKVLVDRPQSNGPNAFVDQPLIMHVRECNEQEIRIPFHVGADHSRTWVLTRTVDGLRLKHDHRKPDGSDDPVTMYGGDTAGNGSADRQEFPVDAFSRRMFTREGMTVSNSNVWAIEVEAGLRFVYELSRTDQDRLFRVGFDLTRPVAAPPAPWGASGP